MEKENKVKKFFKENRYCIAGIAAGALCAAIGAGAMYYAKKDAIELGNALDTFKDENGTNDLMGRMTKDFGKFKNIIYDGGIHNQNCTDYGQMLIERGYINQDETVAGLYALITNK